jgi:hypothetical protein
MFVLPDLTQPALRLPPLALAANVALIATGICRALAARCATDRAIQPISLLLWGRLYPAAVDFLCLFARWREGRLQAARECRRQPRAKAHAVTKQKFSLPRAFAWLVKLVPEAAVFGSQLQQLLTDPEMALFLADAPQAGRIIHPLCRMLGVQPLPQMRPPQALDRQGPDPATPAPETAAVDISTRKWPTVETPASQARPRECEESGIRPAPLSPAGSAPPAANFSQLPT